MDPARLPAPPVVLRAPFLLAVAATIRGTGAPAGRSGGGSRPRSCSSRARSGTFPSPRSCWSRPCSRALGRARWDGPAFLGALAIASVTMSGAKFVSPIPRFEERMSSSDARTRGTFPRRRGDRRERVQRLPVRRFPHVPAVPRGARVHGRAKRPLPRPSGATRGSRSTTPLPAGVAPGGRHGALRPRLAPPGRRRSPLPGDRGGGRLARAASDRPGHRPRAPGHAGQPRGARPVGRHGEADDRPPSSSSRRGCSRPGAGERAERPARHVGDDARRSPECLRIRSRDDAELRRVGFDRGAFRAAPHGLAADEPVPRVVDDVELSARARDPRTS